MILEILKHPDPRLRRLAEPVEVIDGDIRQLVADMIETMYAANGIGLAATQVDRHFRVVVIDVSDERNQARVFINPEIVTEEIGRQEYEEGCLSKPGVYMLVERPRSVMVFWTDIDGIEQEALLGGLLGRCIQHEIDHLNGILIGDVA